MRKAHLDALALISRLEEALRPHQPARNIAGILMDIPRDFPCELPGATTHLERTDIAIELGSTIKKRPAVVYGAAGVQHLVVGADINASPVVPPEIRA